MKWPFFILFLSWVSANGKDTLQSNQNKSIEVLNDKVASFQQQLDDSKQHNKDLNDAYKDEINKLLEEKSNAIDQRIAIYVAFFVTAILAVFGFFRWLGKSEIRRIVNEQAKAQIDEQLKVKLSDNIIDQKLTALGRPLIEQMLSDITVSKEKAQLSAEELERTSMKYQSMIQEFDFLSSKKNITDRSNVIKTISDEKNWLEEGKQAYSDKQFEIAVEMFNKSLNANPSSNDTFFSYYYRGLSYYSLLNYDKAINDFIIADSIRKQHYVLFIRASAYYHLKKYELAIKDINESLEINPNYAVAINLKKRILDNMAT